MEAWILKTTPIKVVIQTLLWEHPLPHSILYTKQAHSHLCDYTGSNLGGWIIRYFIHNVGIEFAAVKFGVVLSSSIYLTPVIYLWNRS